MGISIRNIAHFGDFVKWITVLDVCPARGTHASCGPEGDRLIAHIAASGSLPDQSCPQ